MKYSSNKAQRQTWGRDAGHISRNKTVKRGLSIAYFICKICIPKIQSGSLLRRFMKSSIKNFGLELCISAMCLWLYFAILEFEWCSMKDYFCYCIHDTTFFWYFCCWCSFLKQSCSIWFVICVWKRNILLEILIICVKPHILLISLLNIWPILPFYFVFDFCQNQLCRGSCHAFFDSPIQKKSFISWS